MIRIQDKTIALKRITRKNYREIIKLEVKPEQRKLVASNAVSLADAYFYRAAWFRAIYADNIPIGFVMLADLSLKYKIITHYKPRIFLWRLMIAKEYQGEGYGYKAMMLIIEHVRSKSKFKELMTSYVPTDGNAGKFYEKLGFKPTGKIQDGEIEMSLKL